MDAVSGGHPFEGVHRLRELHSRWVLDQQMHVLVFPVELGQICAEVGAHIPHMIGPRCGQMFADEHLTAVFGHKNHMCV